MNCIADYIDMRRVNDDHVIGNTFEAVLDSLDMHITVIDGNGEIRYVNQAWKDFAKNNGMDKPVDWCTFNYLSICRNAANDDDYSLAIAEGIQSVIDSDTVVFEYEYPCHSPIAKRWYSLRVSPLKDVPNLFVVCHQNITRNKVNEKQAKRLSEEDPLTGLYNRRGLDASIQKELARAVRYQVEMSFVLMDIDHFKVFNDCFGHQAGDRCLLAIADIIKKYTRRPSDIAARIGGDEFVLIFSKTPREKVLFLVDAIKRSVYDLNLKNDSGHRITISAGISLLIPDANHDYQEIIYQQADAALYHAKKERNCISVAG
jgi:diguanylate cyclase (GGDEF)-like protein